MYFRLMCKAPCLHRFSERMNSDELIRHLTSRNLHVADSKNTYRVKPQLLVRELHDEAAKKTLQTEKEMPEQIWFLPVSCRKKDAVTICAIAQIAGKDELLLFSSDFSFIEFYAKRDFPLIVW